MQSDLVIKFFGFQLVIAMVFSSLSRAEMAADRPIVIAHRGASGYVPEHTEAAKVLAFAQGADYIEQDVVLSKDGVFVVSHDITMDSTCDVATRYPERRREDGHFYFADFDWLELRTLALHERTGHNSDKQVFAGRFPSRMDQRLLTLEDEIRLIQGLNKTLGRTVGIYVELKAPAWHLQQFGSRMGTKLLPLLRSFGYTQRADACFIQCFEPEELVFLRQELHCDLRLIQLLGGRPLGLSSGRGDADQPVSRQAVAAQMIAELEAIAQYADGVGPPIELLVQIDSAGAPKPNTYVAQAHQAKLLVHPYTVRADSLPPWASSVAALHSMLLSDLQVDGFFTDFPDLGRQFVDQSVGNN